MKNLLPIAIIALLCCSCKSTELVFISVQEPAPVTLPSYIKTVGVVNRTNPSDKTRIIDVVDKVFSMEGPNLDKEGTIASINGLRDQLMKNNRFLEVKSLDNTDLRTSTPGVFPFPIAWDEVAKICRDNNTDALFAVELFDTDSKINYAASPVSINTPLGKIPGIEHRADMQTVVKTGWRIYDPSSKTILDEYAVSSRLHFSGKGINPVIAAGALINRKDAVKQVGEKTGQDYAFRIIPYWIRVTRDYYVKGTENFIIGRRKAQTGNWDEAAILWQKETSNTDRKIAGRACYNMAIISEINGNIDQAIQWAQKAYEDYNNRLALHYVRLLENRKINNRILKDQE
jgi:tetratricopeptide (TPR) repeat protein